MIYVTGKIAEAGYWGHFTRLYVRALQETELPLWALWSDTCPVQEETVDPAFRSILRLGSTMDEDGKVRSPEPAHAVVRIGPVMDVLAQHMRDPAPYNVILTSWATDSVPKRLVRRLNVFNEVWVSTAQEHMALTASGVENVHVVGYPLAMMGTHEVKAEEKAGEFLFYAIGYWNGWDDCQVALNTYLKTFTTEKVRLLLMCPDAPLVTQEDLEEYAAALGCSEVPKVSIVRRLPKSWKELTQVHAMGDAYVSPSHYWGGSLDEHLATSCGSVLAYAYTTEGIPADRAQAPFSPPQLWRSTDIEELRVSMQEALHTTRKPVLVEHDAYILRANMASWDESLAPPAPKVVAGNPNAKVPPALAIIIPHRDRGAAALEVTLSSLAGQVGIMDEVIISDQGSEEDCYQEVLELCQKFGATLVSDRYDGEWSIARARNAGLAVAEGTAEWVWCLDADIVVSKGFVDAMKQEIMEHPEKGIAPIVVELAADVSVLEARGGLAPVEVDLGQRIGSGVAALPGRMLVEERGWDEWFVGYGSEDIDLLFRLRGKRGWEVKSWDDGPRLYHRPHSAQHAGGTTNLERSMARSRGELGWEVNERGWGEGAELVLRRGNDA